MYWACPDSSPPPFAPAVAVATSWVPLYLRAPCVCDFHSGACLPLHPEKQAQPNSTVQMHLGVWDTTSQGTSLSSVWREPVPKRSLHGLLEWTMLTFALQDSLEGTWLGIWTEFPSFRVWSFPLLSLASYAKISCLQTCNLSDYSSFTKLGNLGSL